MILDINALIKDKIPLYHYDETQKFFSVANMQTSDNNIFRDMIKIIDFLEARGVHYRVENDHDIRIWDNDYLDHILVELDEEGRTIYFNDYACQVTGYSKSEVLHRTWFDLFIPENEKDEISRVHQGVLKSHMHCWQYSNPILRKDGSMVMVDWNNLLVTKDDGSVEKVMSRGSLKDKVLINRE